jgi:hypothetical protein
MSRAFLVPLRLPADPTAALEAATKQYVDSRAAAGNALGIVAIGSMPGTNPTIPINAWTSVTNTLSVTLNTGRRYRVFIAMRAIQVAPAANIPIRLLDGSTGVGNRENWVGGNYGNVQQEWLLDGDNALHQLNVQLNPNTGTVIAYNDYSYLFYVEDVGPNSTPALPLAQTAPAWTTLTPINGWTAGTAGSGLLQYRKIGDLVTLRGQGIGGAHNSVMTVLPAGFRPPTPTFSTVNYMYQGAITFGLVTIYNNGNITVQAPNGAAPQNIILDNISFSTTA